MPTPDNESSNNAWTPKRKPPIRTTVKASNSKSPKRTEESFPASVGNPKYLDSDSPVRSFGVDVTSTPGALSSAENKIFKPFGSSEVDDPSNDFMAKEEQEKIVNSAINVKKPKVFSEALVKGLQQKNIAGESLTVEAEFRAKIAAAACSPGKTPSMAYKASLARQSRTRQRSPPRHSRDKYLPPIPPPYPNNMNHQYGGGYGMDTWKAVSDREFASPFGSPPHNAMGMGRHDMYPPQDRRFVPPPSRMFDRNRFGSRYGMPPPMPYDRRDMAQKSKYHMDDRRMPNDRFDDLGFEGRHTMYDDFGMYHDPLAMASNPREFMSPRRVRGPPSDLEIECAKSMHAKRYYDNQLGMDMPPRGRLPDRRPMEENWRTREVAPGPFRRGYSPERHLSLDNLSLDEDKKAGRYKSSSALWKVRDAPVFQPGARSFEFKRRDAASPFQPGAAGYDFRMDKENRPPHMNEGMRSKEGMPKPGNQPMNNRFNFLDKKRWIPPNKKVWENTAPSSDEASSVSCEESILDDEPYVVYFGNLPLECTDIEIKSELTQMNEAWSQRKWENVVVKKRGKRKYAFVPFATMESAVAAVERLHRTPAFGSRAVDARFQKRRFGASNEKRSISETVEKLYELVEETPDGLKMSELADVYEKRYGEALPFGQNLLKFLVGLERLLLIDCTDEDILIFITETPAFRVVIDLLQPYPDGLTVAKFKTELGQRLNATLTNCDMTRFLKRWRVLNIVEDADKPPTVRLVPMGGCTVFFGNLDKNCRKTDILRDLTKVNASWSNLSVRMNRTRRSRSPGARTPAGSAAGSPKTCPADECVVNAFTDFPTLAEAKQAISYFNGNDCFNSRNVRAELENASAQKTDMGNFTVYFSNLLNGTTKDQIIDGLSKLEKTWRRLVVTVDHRYGEAFAFVEFPSLKEAQQAIRYFHNSSGFGSPRVHAELHKRHVPLPMKKRRKGPLSTVEKVYELLTSEGCGMRMSDLTKKYEQWYGEPLKFTGNPLKLFVRMERLLLLNCENDDVMIYVTKEPAFRIVVEILKRNPQGIAVNKFKEELENELKASLDHCDIEDFLERWRFLTVSNRRGKDGKQVPTVHFTQTQNGGTVFFGNLDKSCTVDDIVQDLRKANPSWAHVSVRLKPGKGFSFAFVDFPTMEEAEDAVQKFDGAAAFKSRYVSADVETSVEQKRQSQSRDSVTVYVGNLGDLVTKEEIARELGRIRPTWRSLPIRLNLRRGWSHAFVDFPSIRDAEVAIDRLHGSTKLGSRNLRVELCRRPIRY